MNSHKCGDDGYKSLSEGKRTERKTEKSSFWQAQTQITRLGLLTTFCFQKPKITPNCITLLNCFPGSVGIFSCVSSRGILWDKEHFYLHLNHSGIILEFSMGPNVPFLFLIDRACQGKKMNLYASVRECECEWEHVRVCAFVTVGECVCGCVHVFVYESEREAL